MPKEKTLTVSNIIRKPLREGAADKVMKAALISGPLALVMSTGMLFAMPKALEQPPEVDVQAEIYAFDRVKAWSVDYMTLWLGGSDPGDGSSGALKTLKSMTSAPGEVALSPTPYQVQKLSPYVTATRNEGMGDFVWTVRVDAQVVAPGDNEVRKFTYILPVTEHSDSFRATAMPHQESVLTAPFEVKTAYTQSADVDGPVGTAAQNFATAYLTPGGKSNLGSTVSSEFSGAAVPHSLWKQVDLESVRWYADSRSVDINDAAEGTRIHVLASLKGSTSGSTFSMTDLPVAMVKLSNGQWVVDEIESPLGFNAIETKN